MSISRYLEVVHQTGAMVKLNIKGVLARLSISRQAFAEGMGVGLATVTAWGLRGTTIKKINQIIDWLSDTTEESPEELFKELIRWEHKKKL